jgi:hypothetical protein
MGVGNPAANMDSRQGARGVRDALTDLALLPQQTAVGWLYGPDAVVRLPQTHTAVDASSL